MSKEILPLLICILPQWESFYLVIIYNAFRAKGKWNENFPDIEDHSSLHKNAKTVNSV